jgi:hypothetical protein
MDVPRFMQDPKIFFWVVVTIMVCFPVAVTYWYKFKKAELDTSLKRDMVARGMSVEEIERVLAAKNRGSKD